MDGDHVRLFNAVASLGKVSIENTGIIYIPNENWTGQDTITVVVMDATGLISETSIIVDVTAINDAPIASLVKVNLNEDETIIIDPIRTSFDVENDALELTAVSAATYGWVELINNKIHYTPHADFYGKDTIVYTISDGNGGQVQKELSLNVKSINDVPFMTLDHTVIFCNGAFNFNVNDLITDIEGDELNFESIEALHGSFSLDGQITYIANEEFVGQDNISFIVSDSYGAQLEGAVTMVVSSLLSETHFTINEDDTKRIELPQVKGLTIIEKD